MDELKRYQQKRDSCEFCKDTPDSGLMCFFKGNRKCCLNNCPYINNQPMLPVENIKKGVAVSHLGANDGGANASVNEQKALKLRNTGYSYAKIALNLVCSKSTAHKYVVNAHRKLHILGANDKGVGERFAKLGANDYISKKIRLHNDEIKIKAKIQWNDVKGKIIPLRFTEYKQISTESEVIRAFKNNTLTIRFLDDIGEDTPDKAETEANKRIWGYLNNLDIKGVSLPEGQSYVQLSRHYAILGTDLAKKYISEKRTLITHDWIDGKVRERIDFSKSEGMNRPEIDAEHVLHGKKDANTTEQLLEDVENKEHDLLSVTKKRLDDTDKRFDKISLLLENTNETMNNAVRLQNNMLKERLLDAKKQKEEIQEEVFTDRPSYIN